MCVCVDFVMCGYVYVWKLLCVCVCVDFVKCGFLYVWNLRSVGVCMCGSCEFWSCVCVVFGKCMLYILIL